MSFVSDLWPSSLSVNPDLWPEQFPGLISGCTVDWFQRWPRDALIAVSHHFLSQYNDLRCSEDVKRSVVVTMGTFQVVLTLWPGVYYQRVYQTDHMTSFPPGPGGREMWRVLWAFPPTNICNAQVLPFVHWQLQDHLHWKDRSRRHAGRAHEDRYRNNSLNEVCKSEVSRFDAWSTFSDSLSSKTLILAMFKQSCPKFADPSFCFVTNLMIFLFMTIAQTKKTFEDKPRPVENYNTFYSMFSFLTFYIQDD